MFVGVEILLKENWKDAEMIVKEHYKEKGYTALNQNDRGFPDLIVLKDGKVSFFVEVKAMQEPDINLSEIQYHQYLENLGFKVKCINVRKGNPEPFQPDPEWAKAVRETYPPFEG